MELRSWPRIERGSDGVCVWPVPWSRVREAMNESFTSTEQCPHEFLLKGCLSACRISIIAPISDFDQFLKVVAIFFARRHLLLA